MHGRRDLKLVRGYKMIEKTIDAVALGELLVDFTEAGISGNGMRLFEQNAGGAPANMLTVLSHFGFKTEFIGKIGKDMHGAFLRETLKKEGIGVRNLIEDENYFTTLAFVALNNGEREFAFARKPGADTQLRSDEVSKEILASCRIFHFGSLSLTDSPAREATIQAVKTAKQAGAVISYDPNYRKPLWPSEAEAVKQMNAVIKYADIMKVSDEEAVMLTGEAELESAAEKLSEAGPAVVAVTLGSSGVLTVSKNGIQKIPAFKVEAVDTTGAGDSFWGGFLSAFLELGKRPEELTDKDIEHCAVTGNAAAALCVTKRGGIPSVPQKQETEEYILNGKRKRP